MIKNQSTLDLVQYLDKISKVIRLGIPGRYWVRTEIMSLREMSSGHCFLELRQTNEKGDVLAKSSATAWRSSWKDLSAKFLTGTGKSLSPGMRVLIEVSADMSAQYGLKLTLHDIDPAWTLGDAEALKQQLRKKLQSEGIIDNNLKLNLPDVVTSVLLIAPEGSAGLEDFMMTVQKIQHHGLCLFDIRTCVFEGSQAALRISENCNSIQGFEARYDVIVIIRGGGAASSLSWLDGESLARAICLSNLPVIFACGHEKDRNFPDELCTLSLGTPSKAAQWLYDRVVAVSLKALTNFESLHQLALTSVQLTFEKADYLLSETVRLSYARIALARQLCDSAMREAVGLSPMATVARGYPAATIAGKFITCASDVRRLGGVDLLFTDGTIGMIVSENSDDFFNQQKLHFPSSFGL